MLEKAAKVGEELKMSVDVLLTSELCLKFFC